MNDIEVSINLSMSGMSFQPSNNNNSVLAPVKMSIKQQSNNIQPTTKGGDFYPPASTTPTDMLDAAKACVY